MERDKDLTGGDLAVGEESMKKNLGMRDLSGFMEEYNQKYKSENEEIDWARITNFVLMGGLFGSTLATLYWNKDASSKSYFFWGLMLGSCASAFLMWSFLVYRQLQQEGSSKYERDMAAKKEALRRKEQETFERHDEFVYYDAAEHHAACFRLLCCPHYGKITSERILYSEQTPFPAWQRGCCFGCSFKYFAAVLAWPWAKRVQSMDIDSVTDVGVDQSCLGYMTNTGTVIVNVVAHADASAVEGQREKLRLAIASRSPADLRAALDAAGGADLPELRADMAEAHRLAAELSAGYHAPYVAAKGNTLFKLEVLSVARPYAVLDDLSYKITKNKGVSWKK